MKIAYVLLCALIAILAFTGGFVAGFREAVHLGVLGFFKLMDYKKINIDIDKPSLEAGILQYKNNIGGCLFLENRTGVN